MPLTSSADPSRARRAHDRQILRLAVPAFGALVAEPLFLLTDTVVVGRLPAPALGALGVAGTVLSFLDDWFRCAQSVHPVSR